MTIHIIVWYNVNMKKTIKATILYYYAATLAYILMIIPTMISDTATSMGYSGLYFYILVPIISLGLGFLAGGAKSYAKWGFPIYMALLTFCLSVLIMATDPDGWIFIALSFALSLIGVTIRHLIRRHRRRLT